MFPGPFKSSSKSPLRSVTNIPRNVPSHWYQSSPLKAVPCGSAAGAGGLDGRPQQCVEIVIVIPKSFFFWGGGGEGSRRSCSRQCRLSQMPDEIKCDWRDHAADGEGPR